jgi:hypothetical protein
MPVVMKLKLHVNKDMQTVHELIRQYYHQYDIIHDSQINQDTHFFVVEKYFFRNSSRASLSVVIYALDEWHTLIEAVGSGGGQGLFFKFDWGAKESFEKAIPKILDENQIQYRLL